MSTTQWKKKIRHSTVKKKNLNLKDFVTGIAFMKRVALPTKKWITTLMANVYNKVENG